MSAAAFKGELVKSIHGMSAEENEPTAASLARVMIENFLFMFLSASGVGFTLSALGIMAPRYDIYVFTLSFSTLWGFVGAAAAWSRAEENIRLPEVFKRIVGSVIGPNNQSKVSKKLATYFSRFMNHIFIPFVHTPRCS